VTLFDLFALCALSRDDSHVANGLVPPSPLAPPLFFIFKEEGRRRKGTKEEDIMQIRNKK
jgi:hypothetical protein